MAVILWLRDHFGIAMLLTFVVLVAAAYRPGNRNRMQEHAQIPLRDDR